MGSNSPVDVIECPLCLDPLDETDRCFKPCKCGYQMCGFCWNHLKEEGNGKCPQCRQPYNPENYTFDQEALLKSSKDKKNNKLKSKKQTVESRKHLSNYRVIQRNLVYVTNVALDIAKEEILSKHEYFGQYGNVVKIVVNRSHIYQGSSVSCYITYSKPEEAYTCIESVDGCELAGKILRASFGTTKYCTSFIKNKPCPNPDCMYLHELGDENDCFTKEDVQARKHLEKVPLPISQGKYHSSSAGLPPPRTFVNATSEETRPQDNVEVNNTKPKPTISKPQNNVWNAPKVTPISIRDELAKKEENIANSSDSKDSVSGQKSVLPSYVSWATKSSKVEDEVEQKESDDAFPSLKLDDYFNVLKERQQNQNDRLFNIDSNETINEQKTISDLDKNFHSFFSNLSLGSNNPNENLNGSDKLMNQNNIYKKNDDIYNNHINNLNSFNTVNNNVNNIRNPVHNINNTFNYNYMMNGQYRSNFNNSEIKDNNFINNSSSSFSDKNIYINNNNGNFWNPPTQTLNTYGTIPTKNYQESTPMYTSPNYLYSQLPNSKISQIHNSNVNNTLGSHDQNLEDDKFKFSTHGVNYRLWPNTQMSNTSKDTLITNNEKTSSSSSSSSSSNTKETFNFFPLDSFKPSLSFTEQFFGLNQQRLQIFQQMQQQTQYNNQYRQPQQYYQSFQPNFQVINRTNQQTIKSQSSEGNNYQMWNQNSLSENRQKEINQTIQ